MKVSHRSDTCLRETHAHSVTREQEAGVLGKGQDALLPPHFLMGRRSSLSLQPRHEEWRCPQRTREPHSQRRSLGGITLEAATPGRAAQGVLRARRAYPGHGAVRTRGRGLPSFCGDLRTRPNAGKEATVGQPGLPQGSTVFMGKSRPQKEAGLQPTLRCPACMGVKGWGVLEAGAGEVRGNMSPAAEKYTARGSYGRASSPFPCFPSCPGRARSRVTEGTPTAQTSRPRLRKERLAGHSWQQGRGQTVTPHTPKHNHHVIPLLKILQRLPNMM